MYSQILCVKRICSTSNEFERNCEVLQEQFTKKCHDSSSIESKIKKIKLLYRKYLPTPKTTQKAQVLPRIVTYNPTFPNIKQIFRKHWSILKTNKAFSVEPIIAFRKTKSLKQLIGGNTIQNDKIIKKSRSKYEGKCTPCKIWNTVTVLFTGTKHTFIS